ncbi:MAG: mechanosensitive ion channel family protein [bacterium]
MHLHMATIAGNELWRIGSFSAFILAGLVIGRVGRWLFLVGSERMRRLGRSLVADALDALAPSSVFLCFALALRIGVIWLTIPERFMPAVQSTGDVLVALAIGFTAYNLVSIVELALRRQFPDVTGVGGMVIPLVRKSIRVTVVILTILQVATILSDKPVTSLLAGLGVGGLAVALAAQETIKNFFGSLVISADRPFEIGDRVVVDGFDGPVEDVGFRSTRIRTLEGHLITIPNGELANKTIQNIGKRPYIRRNTVISVTYDTPPDKVRRALEILRELLRNHEGQQPDLPPRVFFDQFGAASLDLRMLYWYHPPEYWKFVEFGERLNLQILERFNAEGIDFAFPTQTLYLAGDAKRPLTVRTEATPT